MPKRPIRADDLFRITFVGDAQFSPDGQRVLFSRKCLSQEKNKAITQLCVVDSQGHVVELTQGESGAAQGRWAPDGSSIAFISKREGVAAQIHLLPTSGGEAKALTNLPEGSIGEMKWSPDSRWLAITFRPALPETTSAAKKARDAANGSTPPLVTESIWYRLDGDGYFMEQRYEVMLVDAATGEAKTILKNPAQDNYSFDWAPNSKELAIAINTQKRPFAEPPNDQIFRVDLDGQSYMIPGLPKGEKSSVRWSPDGKWIAYAGDVDENDPWGTRNTRLWVVSADGGTPKNLFESVDYDLGASTLSDTKDASFGSSLDWLLDSRTIIAAFGWQGSAQILRATLDGEIEVLTEGNHTISYGSVHAATGRVAACYGHATMLGEVATVEQELGTGRWVPKVLTHFNGDFADEVEFVEPEEFWIDGTPNKDGSPSRVHGWVMKPVGYLPPRRYPAVLQIHGGPHAQYGWTFFHEMQLLAASGYVVVYTNPRGSKGYGEAHCREIQGDWGHKDWEDIESVTRWMQAQTYIHPGQMGVMGGSYGGYMTNWVVGHCNDYKAAITDRCVSNMVSMAMNSDFPFNKDGYFKGVAWGDLESIRELWRQSPIAYFDKVTTPMLIIHSEGDLRCNVEQGESVFCALQQQGVESRFVRYPSTTSHGMSRSGPPDLRLHRLGEILAWWDRFLK
jgi:dipeptidyl aminopeptidase/acylaminoacyl peptidase